MPLIIETSEGRTEHPLADGVTIIGRDPRCHIAVADASLSRRHLELNVKGSECVIRDLNSKNGSYLGPQRIREAHLRPGVRIRAGKVWIYMKSEDASIPGGTLTHPPDLGPAMPIDVPAPEPAAAPRPVSLDAVPDDAAFSEEEEPTPVDESVADSAVTDATPGGTRLVVRDNRWYVQDNATGAEVEIVPVGGPTAAPPPDQLALPPGEMTTPAAMEQAQANLPVPVQPGMQLAPLATLGAPLSAEAGHTAPVAAVRSRRFWILVGIAGVAVLATLTLLMVPKKPPPPPMGLGAYYKHIDTAVADFRQAKRDLAIDRLKALQRQKVENRPQLAVILQKAMEYDGKLLLDFRDAWEQAQRNWEDVRDSTWQSGKSKELAEERLLWILGESMNMAHVTEAKRMAEVGRMAQCLERATAVSEDSVFREEAEKLIEQTKDTVVRGALEEAAAEEKARRWDTAIKALERIARHRPDMAESMQPRLKKLERFRTDAKALDEAKALAAGGRHVEAMNKLRAIGADSPYRQDAADLSASWSGTHARRQARDAYNSGDGARALKILEGAGLKDDKEYWNIQGVMAALANAERAMTDADFQKAGEEIAKVLQLETRKTNFYAAKAARLKAEMPKRRSDLAQSLIDQADLAVRKRDFANGRRNYEKALALDPGRSATIIARLGELRKTGIMDYNRALQIWRTQPKDAMKLLQEVKDRLPPFDSYYKHADALMLRIQRQQK